VCVCVCVETTPIVLVMGVVSEGHGLGYLVVGVVSKAHRGEDFVAKPAPAPFQARDVFQHLQGGDSCLLIRKHDHFTPAGRCDETSGPQQPVTTPKGGTPSSPQEC